jgi:hypothetical protein
MCSSPNLLLIALRHTPGGPYELAVADRRTRRLVTLSRNAFVDPSANYLGGCDVPGVLIPGGSFIYFAETTTVPGQIDLFLVRSDLTDVPRLVGTTLAAGCTVPAVSRDGSTIAVQEIVAGTTTVKTATW